jgi:hypothetical protein
MPDAKQKLLGQHALEIMTAVRAELPEFTFQIADEYCVDGISNVLFGLENNISRKSQVLTEC